MKSPKLSCSFCGKDASETPRLISSPDVMKQKAYICQECVAVCVTILNENGQNVIGNPSNLTLRVRLARKLAGAAGRIHEIKEKTTG